MTLCLFQTGLHALGTLNIVLPLGNSPSGLDAIRKRRYESFERYSIFNLSLIVVILALTITLIGSPTS